MKRLKKYTVILILIFCSVTIYGQSKGDNAITIKDFKKKTDFSSVKRILITNGYELKTFNTGEEFFSTEFHPIEGSVYAYNLKIKIIGFVQDNDLVLTANYTSQYAGAVGMTDASGRASFEKRKNISKRLAFDELKRISLKINPELLYSQE